MIGPEISLLVDIVGMGLLSAVIVYAVRLNNRLNSLKADKKELEALLAGFNQSTQRAENAIARLKMGSAEAGDAVSEQLAQARELRDDLAFMVDRASEAARRLEGAIGDSRSAGAGPAAPKVSKPVGPVPPERRAPAGADREARGAGRSKSDLLKTLQGMR